MVRGMQAVVLLLAGWLLFAGEASAGTAQEAWSSLVGKKAINRPEMIFVQNDPALPNVLIYQTQPAEVVDATR